MTPQSIKATEIERQFIARRIAAANDATAIATEVFSMFCEGHGIPGATFVGMEGDSVIVLLPETKPALVQEEREA